MANSGTINGSFNGSNASHLIFKVEWSLISQDPASITSNVRLKWIVRKDTASLSTYKQSAPWSQTCDGTATSGTLNFNLGNVAVNTDYVVRDITVTIQQTANTAKTAAISGSLDLSGTSAGTGSFSGSMSLPAIVTSAPSVTALTITDAWASKPAGITDYVSGFTKLSLTATATSSAGIANYSFYNGNTLLQSSSSNTFTYSNANNAGIYKFKVVVTDNYGNSTTYPTTIPDTEVVQYVLPKITSTTTFRCDQYGNASSTGSYATLAQNWSTAGITGIYYVGSCTLNGSTYSVNKGTVYVKNAGLSASTSYYATYTVTDTLGGTATKSDYIPSAFVNFDLYPSNGQGGMGVSMVAEVGLASFNIPIKPYKGLRHAQYLTPATLASLESSLLSIFSDMPQQTQMWIESNPSAALDTFGSTPLVLCINKVTTNSGTITAWQANSSGGHREYRNSIVSDALTGWVENRYSILYYDEGTASNYTAGSSNYQAISKPASLPAGAMIVGVSALTWSSNSGAFWIMPYATGGNGAYLIANSGTTVNGLKLRWWYAI